MNPIEPIYPCARLPHPKVIVTGVYVVMAKDFYNSINNIKDTVEISGYYV